MATVTRNESLHRESADVSLNLDFQRLFRALGSLKFTVALFAISLILVLVGTLAQDELNMQEVKSRYFLSWIAWMRIDDFFPQAFYSHDRAIPGVLPFPGGALVGVLLMINLVAAKITRFKMHASGSRLTAGVGFLIAGFIVAGLIIASGHSSDGLQGAPPITYQQLWGVLMAGLALLGVGSLWAITRTDRLAARIGYAIAAIFILGFIAYSLASGYRIGDPGLRIVWQLLKGVGAGLILLVGCQLLFDKQGGNVLLHLGVGLLMVGQFAFGDRQLEQRLRLVEEEVTNTFVNLDELELTFVTEQEGEKQFVAVPASRLQRIEGTGEVIRDDSLPVDVGVIDYFPNSQLVDIANGSADDNPATVGIGTRKRAEERPTFGGASGEVNLAAAYVELLDKQTGDSLGTYLVAQELSDLAFFVRGRGVEDYFDEVKVGDQAYQVGLRLHREVKPYWVKLEDVRRVNYSGTDTPRDYSSFIRIIDPETGDDRRERVWMNNPLRYRGETFFQSNYTLLPGGKELTGIQVVRNSGWLIPYVACSVIALGMAAHFWGTLLRFLRRRHREHVKHSESVVLAGADPDGDPSRAGGRRRWVLPVALAAVGLFAIARLIPASVMYNVVKPAERDQSIDYYALGKIPTQFGGRVMPLDAYARQTLKAMSNKESIPVMDRDDIPLRGVPGELANRADGRKLSALRWLLIVASDNPKIYDLPMFRIDADEVLAELGGLERRENKLYSYSEIMRNEDAVRAQLEAASEKPQQEYTFKEKKLFELEGRKNRFLAAAGAMRLPAPPRLPDDMRQGMSEDEANYRSFQLLQRQMELIKSADVPRTIPPKASDVADSVDQPKWSAFSSAFFDDARARVLEEGSEQPPSISSYTKMLSAYAKDDELAFNEALDEHLAAAGEYPIPGYNPSKVGVERWMEATHPNTTSIAIYISGLILCLAFFASGHETTRKIAWGVVLISFLIHTVVLVARIYVTGRAPVINLYSSAVFIGWGAVLFGLVVERIFRYGMGTFMASLAGGLTLQVAYGLTLSPGQADTMPVLRAVLDTQFWLSTHVISVSLGYVATMVAGVLGIVYLAAGWLGKSPKALKEIYGSVYGATCLGILFSTIGTILGGLWADDSWGRFWGWDPKENGALLIVIWNALMLHARWDKMVAGRGFSILAIGGNIVTAWSWFGTNELGIGLHSYGFTEGTMFYLTTFFATQLAFIVAGLVFWKQSGGEAA